MREIAAEITTAANAADGRYAVIPGATKMNTTISPAPISGASCVRAPACSATGVRDDDAEMAKPLRKPVAMFAVPIAAISWLPLTVTPARVAKVRDSTLVSAKAINAIPTAAGARVMASATVMPPSAGVGNPRGMAPATDSRSSRSQE